MIRALIFDSGVGGLSILDAVIESRLALAIDYAADNAWLPYGAKSDDQLRTRTPALIASLVSALRPDIVVLACNTASTIALAETREAVDAPVVGVVPPIRPAAQRSRTGVIGLLATEATIARPYTTDLIERFAAGVTVVSVAATALVACAEAKLSGRAQDAGAIDEAVSRLFAEPHGDRLDVVALACTHFPLLRDELAARAPRSALWLDSGTAIARRVEEVSGCTQGAARPRRAAFTDMGAASTLAKAFMDRGFFEFLEIGPEPGFSLALHSPPWSI